MPGVSVFPHTTHLLAGADFFDSSLPWQPQEVQGTLALDFLRAEVAVEEIVPREVAVGF